MNKSAAAYFGELVTEMGWLSSDEIEDALAVGRETGQPIGNVLILRGKLTGKEAHSITMAQSLIRDGYVTRTNARRALSISMWSGLSVEDALLVFLGSEVTSKAPYHNRLGQLLIASACIEPATIEHSLSYCRRAGLPLGRVLTMRNHISRTVLAAALEAQKLLRTRAISIEYAIAGLSAIKDASQVPNVTEIEDLHLGSLLVHAGILDSKGLSDALEVSRINCKPLGQVLLIFAMISESILHTALELQQMMREGHIHTRRAIKALNIVFANNVSVSEALASIGDAPGTGIDISVALFLKRTGLFQERLNELDSIDQSGLGNRDQLGFLSGFVSEQQLVPAVRCSFLVRYSLLTFEQALVAYHYSLLSGQDIDEFLAEVGWVEQQALEIVGRKRLDRHLRSVA
jgi:hypothetical protein